MQENAELKRLLKLAVEDIKTMLTCECVSKICAEQVMVKLAEDDFLCASIICELCKKFNTD